MKTLEKVFKIELTEREIKTIVDSLANTCHNLNEEYKAGKHEVYETLKETRTIRNDLAGLVNRFYMGED